MDIQVRKLKICLRICSNKIIYNIVIIKLIIEIYQYLHILLKKLESLIHKSNFSTQQRIIIGSGMDV